MKLTAYLNFPGTCREAFEFYAKSLNGEIVMMLTHGDSPAAEHAPPNWQDKIMHARLMVGDQTLMGSDAGPEHYLPTQGFSVAIGVDTVAEAERVFAAMSAGGTVQLPIQQTFWAERFGMLVDKYKIAWMVNCETKQ